MQYGNLTTVLLLRNTLLSLNSSSICHVHWLQVIVALLVLIVCIFLYWRTPTGINAPFAGYRSPWEPPLLVQMRYVFNAASMIREGYAKWKDSLFQISRYDGDILIVPPRYLDDLHNKSQEELSAIYGLIRNFGGSYSGITLLGENDVGIRALQTKITPNLAKLCDDIRDEFQYCLDTDFPACRDWTSVSVHPLFLKAVERITHRIFVGLPLCRNPQWVQATSKHAHYATMIQIAMRSVPKFIQPLLNFCLPWPWKNAACVREAKNALILEMQRRRNLEKVNSFDYIKSNDLLQAVMEMSSPSHEDSQLDVVAQIMLTMNTIAGHSTAASGAHALFDMVSHSKYIELLREEALQVFRHVELRVTKQALGDLRKLDSFLRESQRHNPLSLLGFFRVVLDPAGITLQDGTHVPYNTLLCVAPHAISNDPDVIEDPTSFNGLRYYEQRCRDASQEKKHQYATTDKSHLHFGYGTWACPGRFLASDMLKVILTMLLLQYDIRSPERAKRPVAGHFHEFPLFNINTPLLMKRRNDSLVL
uniref:Cytochrome P450 monooxygenase ltmK n=3 Tax=Epichloe TaxID=5112 RepID=LTMK_EPIFF|nr:RecName: Full=Cytochrome P450 monooxygenase ltmK; AltName: Full=Lolitrem B biosynthesis cluster 1 protein K [Epichloe festucae Fl1]Q56RZ5.1 RecName: Full=Cytochrome P450 monooxygenase ltmK; AltName: Full=Lolitrem B biosynthesis cluster 1 protein K [Epichloe festucae var. lolii]AAW88512.1 P450 monooxygenase [Epichloe festucae var. lolii]AAW88516.1 P450 monooxygenase [Epichloe festucae]AGN73069.1 P450 monooxygenase [Epichloe hybrida]